jgi:hypothetical protein
MIDSHLKSTRGQRLARSMDNFKKHRHSWRRIAKRMIKTAVRKYQQAGDTMRAHVSPKEAKTIYSQIKRSRLGFGFPDEFCADRAHVISLALATKNVRSRKIMVRFKEKDGRLIKTKNHPDGQVRWREHVATAVVTKDSRGRKRVMVFDPGLFNRPVLEKTWLRRLGVKKGDSEVKEYNGAMRLPEDKTYPWNINFAAFSLYRVSTSRQLARQRRGFLRRLGRDLKPSPPPPPIK